MLIDEDGPAIGPDKVINDILQSLWFDEEAELEFMQVALLAYGPVLRVGNAKFRSSPTSKD
jgi:hypothetical protein